MLTLVTQMYFRYFYRADGLLDGRIPSPQSECKDTKNQKYKWSFEQSSQWNLPLNPISELVGSTLTPMRYLKRYKKHWKL